MFFTKLAKVAAWLALVLGASQLLIGFSIAMEIVGPYDAALARYAPGAANSGQVINRGLYAVIFAIVIGTLAEIGMALRR